MITLDSSVPGHHYGEITDGQLDWLRAELAVPAPDGTILALHQPPVPCIQDLAVLVELRDQSRLADVLRGSDVRAILAGPSALFDDGDVRRHSGFRVVVDVLHPGLERGSRWSAWS